MSTVGGGMTFLLAADASMARRCRRELAGGGLRVGLRVGTLPELLSVLAEVYLFRCQGGWSEQLHACLRSATEAFWADSYQRDPNGVARAVEGAWREIRTNVGLEDPWPTHSDSRIAARLQDLDRLNAIPWCNWPEDLALMACVLEGRVQPVRSLRVVHQPPERLGSLWLQSVLQKHAAGEMPGLPVVFPSTEVVPTSSRLNTFVSRLGSGESHSALPVDASFQVVNVRDSLEAIELTLGAIRSQLDADATLQPRDFGLLIPSAYPHGRRLLALATEAGLPISNLPLESHERDVGGEFVRFSLMAVFGAPPSMALRALLTNPLMPWSAAEGRQMAGTLLDFGFSIKAPETISDIAKEVLKLVAQGASADEMPQAFRSLIHAARQDEGLEVHRTRALQLAEAVLSAMQSGERDLKALLRLAPLQAVRVHKGRLVNQEGVSIILEDEWPLHSVRRLFVLDFVDGHFPQVPSLSPVFSSGEWRKLQESGLPIVLPAEHAAWSRALFKEQLGHVLEQLLVFVPRLTTTGEALHPSVTLMDMANADGCVQEPDTLLLDLERQADRAQMPWLARAGRQQPVAARPLAVGDMELSQDLLKDYDFRLEEPNTLSPSRLDNLLVSPLAWLLDRMDAMPQGWEPDRFDALTSGSIAHFVFEHLFPAGTQRVSSEDIDSGVEALFPQAIGKYAPALMAPEWAVERENLLGVIRRAASRWAEVLVEVGAEVVQAEMKLRGHVDGIALSGMADAVIRLPNGALAVVDYKNASSSRYQSRMEKGWDLQTALYSRMLSTGGPKDPELKKRLQGLDVSSVTYFTLRDRATCANYRPMAQVAGWRFSGLDPSSKALDMLSQRFQELRAGQVCLPRESVLKAMEKAGLKGYALDASPLCAFTVSDADESA